MNETPIIRDERLGRFKSAQRLVDAIRELDRQIRLTEESGMTIDQAVMVMSVLDTTEPEIQEVIASVITKLSGTLPDKDPDPTPDPETPDTPDPEPEPEPEPETEETPVESEDSETASAVDESPIPATPEPESEPETLPEPETPDSIEDVSDSDDRRTIAVDGVNAPVTVTKDGDVFINGEKQEVLYNTQGYAFLKLPGEKRQVRAVLHSLVMQAFRPTKTRKQVVHKNGNQRDCRLENLAYRDEIKMDKPNFDATDALEASLALVDAHFNVGEAVNLLSARKKRASYDLVRKVMNKEIFTEVSDRYFDAKLHVVQDAPKPQDDAVKTEETEETTATEAVETVEEIKEKMEEKTSLIKKALAESANKIRDAYKLLVKQGHPEITLYEIFNVKNGGAGDPPDDDVVELIRYAKRGGATDIRYTLLSECNLLNISQRQFNKATRGR